jgi:hypothetical protein
MLIARLRERDDFGKHRWRCIHNPERAIDTLGHWAQLDVDIIRAKGLSAPGDTYFVEPNADAVVSVEMDDEIIYETAPVTQSLAPEWNHQGYLNILRPRPFVRLHVKHYGGSDSDTDVGLGFVEFCVGDVPFNKTIEGWFELRFEEHLQKTTWDRYGEHCQTKDFDLYDTHEKADTIRANTMPNSEDAHLGPKSANSTNAFHTTLISSKEKKKSILKCGACGSCKGKGQPNSMGQPGEGGQYRNGGEIYVRLKLRMTGSTSDQIFAMGLPDAPQINFGLRYMPDPYMKPETLQSVADDTFLALRQVYHEALMCIVNYISYILAWNNAALSLFITTMFVLGSLCEWLHGAVTCGVIFAVMATNSFETLRLRMVTSGVNAPLDQAGFDLVAYRGSAKEMHTFIKRYVEKSMGASPPKDEKGQKELWLLASRCFRQRKPLLTLEELRQLLESVSYIEGSKSLTTGTLVHVDDKRNATVQRITDTPDGRKVTVLYDDDPTPKQVPESQVQQRLKLPYFPQSLMPVMLDNTLRRVREVLMGVAKGLLILQYISDIVAWRRRKVARVITVASLFGGVTLYLLHEYHRLCDEQVVSNSVMHQWAKAQLHMHCNHEKSGVKAWNASFLEFFHFLLVFCLDHGAHASLLVVGTFIFVHDAWFLKPFNAVFRVVRRLLVQKRKAPEHWVFFRSETGGA